MGHTVAPCPQTTLWISKGLIKDFISYRIINDDFFILNIWKICDVFFHFVLSINTYTADVKLARKGDETHSYVSNGGGGGG